MMMNSFMTNFNNFGIMTTLIIVIALVIAVMKLSNASKMQEIKNNQDLLTEMIKNQKTYGNIQNHANINSNSTNPVQSNDGFSSWNFGQTQQFQNQMQQPQIQKGLAPAVGDAIAKKIEGLTLKKLVISIVVIYLVVKTLMFLF